VYIAVTIALLVGTGQLFSYNKSRLTFTHISKWWDTEYNKSISSHAKDATDINLMHLKL